MWIGCPEYSESDVARRLHAADRFVREFVRGSREKAEEIAEGYKQAFIAEGEAQGEAAKEEVQRRYAQQIQEAKDAKAYYDEKLAYWNHEKAKLEAHLKNAGVCKYQDIDPVSGKKMRMLAQVPLIDSKPHADTRTTTGLHSVTNTCSYLGPNGGEYRGAVDHTEDGTKCLPWPKGWAGKYHGSGLAKDLAACDEFNQGSRCYEACLDQQETNSYCRNPTDAKQPYCRTGGTDEDPIFSTCKNVYQCEDDGCTHNKPDGSDYDGTISFTLSGKTCDMWKNSETYREQAATEGWHNYCRNPDGKKLAWCLVSEAAAGWEFCDVGKSCTDDKERSTRVDEAKKAGPVLPFPTEGLYAHYTSRGWEATTSGQWDDESGNGRHSVSSAGLVRQGFAAGFGAQSKVGYMSGSVLTSVQFPQDIVPESFSICSVTRYANSGATGQILANPTEMWFHGHDDGQAGVAYYSKWMTDQSSESGVAATDWLVMCGQNGGSPTMLANGRDVSLDAPGGHGGVQLSINKLQKPSAWDVIGLTIWDRLLSPDEMKQAADAYADFLHDGGAFGISLKGGVTHEPFPRAGIHSHFTPDGWGKTAVGQWDDESGFGRHSLSSQGDISVQTGAEYGAGGRLAYLQGSPEASIVFPKGSISHEFTICSLSRYAGDKKNKILAKVDLSGANECWSADLGSNCWFHGHVDGKVGVAYYNQWKTETSSVYLEDEAQHWLVMCGQNKKGGVQLANGMERSIDERTVLSGGQGDEQLAVNGQGALQASHWALHGLTIWDRHLSRLEITAASNAYLSLLATGGSSITMRS